MLVGIIFSGTVVSRSGNFEAGLSAKKLIKSFNRQYSIYPNGSPQYRLMERKAMLEINHYLKKLQR